MSRNSIITIANLLELSSTEDKSTPISSEVINDKVEEVSTPISASEIESVTSLKELVEVLDKSSQLSDAEDKAVLTSTISLKVSELLADDIKTIADNELETIISEELEKLAGDTGLNSNLAEVSETISEGTFKDKLTEAVNDRLYEAVINNIKDEVERLHNSGLNSVKSEVESLSDSGLNSLASISEPISDSSLVPGNDVQVIAPEVTINENVTEDVADSALNDGTDGVNDVDNSSLNEDTDEAGSLSKQLTPMDAEKVKSAETKPFNNFTKVFKEFIPNLVAIFTESKVGSLVQDIISITSLKSDFMSRVETAATNAVHDAMEIAAANVNSLANGAYTWLNNKSAGWLDTGVDIAREVYNLDYKSLARRLTNAIFKTDKGEELPYDTLIDRKTLLYNYDNFAGMDDPYKSYMPAHGGIENARDNRAQYSEKSLTILSKDVYEDGDKDHYDQITDAYKYSNTLGQPQSKASYYIDHPDYSKFYTDFKDEESWWLDNSYDWTVSIVPYKITEDTNLFPPDLRNYFIDNNSGILPIKSYSIDDGDLVYSSIDMNYGSIRTLSPAFSYPTSISLVLPVTVTKSHTKWNSLLDWKEAYVNYVRGESSYSENNAYEHTISTRYGMTGRDYRLCCYEITIHKIRDVYKDSQYYEESKLFRTYIGLPNVSLSDSGQSNKVASDATLMFHIVGEL